MDATGKEFAEFWNLAANKGWMNSYTAKSLIAPVKQIMSVDDDWDSKDVTTLDVDDLLHRFRNKRRLDFSSVSLRAYERRFKFALNEFQKYLNDPDKWIAEKSSNSSKTKKTTRIKGGNKTEESVEDSRTILPITSGYTSMVDYPFVLRENCLVRLKLPIDLQVSDIDRLTAFLKTLVVETNHL